MYESYKVKKLSKPSKTLCQGPKKPPVSLFGNKPSGKKPVIQQQVQTERPGRPKKSPPTKKAPPRPKKGTKAPVTKAPTKGLYVKISENYFKILKLGKNVRKIIKDS